MGERDLRAERWEVAHLRLQIELEYILTVLKFSYGRIFCFVVWKSISSVFGEECIAIKVSVGNLILFNNIVSII